MAHIDFGDTDEEAFIVLKMTVQQLHADAYGNGQPGMFGQFKRFMHIYEGGEVERAKQHKANTIRLNLLLALAMLIVAILALFLTYAAQHKSEVIFPEIFRSSPQSLEYTARESPPLTAQGD